MSTMELKAQPLWRRLTAYPETGILLALIALCVGITLAEPNFAGMANIFLLSRQISYTAIAALGVFFVILTAGIDLSLGSVAALGGVVCGLAMAAGAPPAIGAAIGLLAGIGVGLINGWVVAVLGVTPFIVTLGMLSMARGLVLVVTKGEAVRNIPPSFINFGNSELLSIPLSVWILLVMAVIAQAVLRYSVFGLRVLAIGGNEEAAKLSGVPVKRVKLLTYALGGFCAAVSGVLFVARFQSAQADAGLGMELDAIAACVIGGTSLMGGRGTVLGVLIGATVMGVLHNGLVLLQVSAYWQELIIGAVIVLAAVLDMLRQRKS